MSGLNIVDGYIIALLLLSALIGIYRGFLREFLTIITLIMASAVAYLFGKQVGQLFTFIDSDLIKDICGMFCIFIVVFIIGFIAKLLVFKICKVSGPSALDRITGAMFGLLRGVAVVVAVLLMVNQAIMAQNWYKKSKLIPFFAIVSDNVVKITPKSWKKDLQQQMREINKQEMELMKKIVEKKAESVEETEPVVAPTDKE